MSKLDDIFRIDAGRTWEVEKAKQQIKALMLELIGEDENTHWGACNNHGDKSNYKCVCGKESRNKLRAELRQKVEAL